MITEMIQIRMKYISESNGYYLSMIDGQKLYMNSMVAFSMDAQDVILKM